MVAKAGLLLGLPAHDLAFCGRKNVLGIIPRRFSVNLEVVFDRELGGVCSQKICRALSIINNVI